MPSHNTRCLTQPIWSTKIVHCRTSSEDSSHWELAFCHLAKVGVTFYTVWFSLFRHWGYDYSKWHPPNPSIATWFCTQNHFASLCNSTIIPRLKLHTSRWAVEWHLPGHSPTSAEEFWSLEFFVTWSPFGARIWCHETVHLCVSLSVAFPLGTDNMWSYCL